MSPAPANYQQLLSGVIKKNMVILGPDITLMKARSVKEITVTDDGTVTSLSASPEKITQALIVQFSQLSDVLVQKTFTPLMSGSVI